MIDVILWEMSYQFEAKGCKHHIWGASISQSWKKKWNTKIGNHKFPIYNKIATQAFKYVEGLIFYALWSPSTSKNTNGINELPQ